MKEEIKKTTKIPHNLTLENRENLIINGVTAVDNFDDSTIDAVTTMGRLTVKGENLNIKKLDLDQIGELDIEGKISELIYKDKGQVQKGFFSKLFK